MTFAEVMHLVAVAFEVVVAVELVVGLVWSVVLSAVVWRRTRDGAATYQALRQCFGSVLLLGLELLVAADLVRTVGGAAHAGGAVGPGAARADPHVPQLRPGGGDQRGATVAALAGQRCQRIVEAHDRALGPRGRPRGAAAAPAGAPSRRDGEAAARRWRAPPVGLRHLRVRSSTVPRLRTPRRRASPAPPGDRAPHSSAPTTAPPSITTPNPMNHDSSTKTMPIGP